MNVLRQLPDEAPEKPKRAKPAQVEYRLQVALADYIREMIVPGVYWSAIANGEDRPKVYDERKGRWYSPTGQRLERAGLRKGNPDLFFIVRGRSVGLELKRPGAKQSEDQIKAEQDWILAGGVYRCADNFDDAIAFLEEQGALRPDRSLRRRKGGAA